MNEKLLLILKLYADEECDLPYTHEQIIGFVKDEIARERERILNEFKQDHLVEYALDEEPFCVKNMCTANEWLTIMLIVAGKKGKIFEESRK